MEAYRYLADIYDLMMEDIDYDAWAIYLHGFLQRGGAKRIFEVACGTGEITQRLYDYGYDIVASDASESMLRVAAKKARKRAREIRYVLQDLRHIETARPVDAVVCACDGLNYVDMEGAATFAQSAYDTLKPGGLLLFDISTQYKLKEVLDGQVFFDDADDAVCIWENRYEKETSALNMDMTIFVRCDKLFERYNERHVQYAHDIGALLNILNRAGYTKADVFEAFTQNAVSPQSGRAQFVCIR